MSSLDIINSFHHLPIFFVFAGHVTSVCYFYDVNGDADRRFSARSERAQTRFRFGRINSYATDTVNNPLAVVPYRHTSLFPSFECLGTPLDPPQPPTIPDAVNGREEER
ncbi:hypothetical protein TSAR_002913 [Trichomalopsis sarcophagae]|uniref:Uncharacterized protein n=1 Tax=Trichomalopsis sarcophagae TaxID=543379 RepID=A0A232EKV0_9HYME|nr:hypothetical protein TSAR_002913 [Trichomalopsis sarcophagae]